MNAPVTSTELQKKIQGYLESLAIETDEARRSDEMVRYLDFVAKFHQYSPSNIFLIMLTKPDATQVAGFQAWKKMGRYIKKGEKGIPIFAPMIHKEDPDSDSSPKVLSGFRIVYVFDVSQTDGDPLPPVPDWKSPEKNAELTEKLIRFAESQQITVTCKELPGETQGVSKGGVIELSPDAGTKTLIHEIAHELMHRDQNNLQNREIKELEAEGVSYAVCRHFGLENLNCPNYLALFNLKSDEIYAHMDRIRNTAHEIITAIDTYS